MSWLALSAAVAAIAASLAYLTVGLQGVSLVVGIPAVGLGYAVAKRRGVLRLWCELALIAELVALGLLWPSVFTAVAVLAAPAAMLAGWNLATRRSRPVASRFISASTLLAAASLLGQAMFLAHHGIVNKGF